MAKPVPPASTAQPLAIGARVAQVAAGLLLLLLFFRPLVDGIVYPNIHEGLVSLAILVGVLAAVAKALGSGARTPRIAAGAMALWVVWGGLSVTWSVDRGTTIFHWFDLLALGCVWWASAQLGTVVRWRKWGIGVLGAALVLTCAYALYQFGVGLEETRRLYFEQAEEWAGGVVADRLFSNRVFATFIAPNVYGDYLATLMPLLTGIGLSRLYAARRGRALMGTCLSVGVFGLSLAALALTVSRGAWLAAFAACALLLVWQTARWILSARGASAVVLLAVTLAGAGTLYAQEPAPPPGAPAQDRPSLVEGMDQRYWAGGLPTFEQLLNTGTLRMRGTYWRGTAAMIRDRPLTGLGWAAWGAAYPKYTVLGGWPTQLAHNNYLQVLAELGPVGLACFLVLLASAFYGGVRHARLAPTPATRWLWAGAACSVVAFAVHSLTDFALYAPSVATVAFAVFGVLSSAPSGTPEPSTAPRPLVAGIVAAAGAVLLVAWQPVRSAAADVRDARAMAQGDNVGGALTLARKAMDEAPWSGEAAALAGRLMMRTAEAGQGPGWQAAVRALARAVRQQPLSPWVRESYADALWQFGRLRRDPAMLEAALAQYAAAVENFPVQPELHARLAWAARNLGRDALAEEHERREAELRPYYRSPTESR